MSTREAISYLIINYKIILCTIYIVFISINIGALYDRYKKCMKNDKMYLFDEIL